MVQQIEILLTLWLGRRRCGVLVDELGVEAETHAALGAVVFEAWAEGVVDTQREDGEEEGTGGVVGVAVEAEADGGIESGVVVGQESGDRELEERGINVSGDPREV